MSSPIHSGVDSRFVFWNDISADHTIGTMPNATISATAGNANAQPTTWSDRMIRRTFTPSGASVAPHG